MGSGNGRESKLHLEGELGLKFRYGQSEMNNQ